MALCLLLMRRAKHQVPRTQLCCDTAGNWVEPKRALLKINMVSHLVGLASQKMWEHNALEFLSLQLNWQKCHKCQEKERSRWGDLGIRLRERGSGKNSNHWGLPWAIWPQPYEPINSHKWHTSPWVTCWVRKLPAKCSSKREHIPSFGCGVKVKRKSVRLVIGPVCQQKAQTLCWL